MFCGAVKTEQDIHREKEARRRDREHSIDRERRHSESPRENFKHSKSLYLYRGERRLF